MQEQIFFNKTLRNISKIGTHLVLHTKTRRRIRDMLFKKMNAKFNKAVLSKYRKQYYNELMYADIVISLGDACQTAYHLQKFGLRKFASPFDWMMCYDLKDIQDLFANDFHGFFVDIEEKKDHKGENGCRYITDLRNGMVSIHAFKHNKSIESQYDFFIETMQRRFVRLKNHILQSKHIIFVTSRPSDMQAFEEFLRFMQGYHNASYTILNITKDKDSNNLFDISRKNITVFNDKLRVIEYSFLDIFPSSALLANAMGGGGGVEPSEHNSIKNNPIIPTNIAQSQTKDIIIKRNGNVHKIYLKIPLFCIPIINKHISYYLRLDLIYSDAHGEWIGNFIQWTKIMLLIVPIEMDLSLHSLDSTKSSNSTSPIMFDDEFLRQDDLVTHKNKQ